MLAERLLLLVLEPAEASAVTGDLLEEQARMGRPWFWRQVCSTFARSLVRELGRDVPFLLRVGIRSSVLQLYGCLAAFFLDALIGFGWSALLHGPAPGWILLLPVAACGAWGGWWSVCRVPGRELAVGLISGPLSTVLLGCALLDVAALFASVSPAHPGMPSGLALGLFCGLELAAFLLTCTGRGLARVSRGTGLLR